MLAYAISGEAGPGKDKAAVAASILNRVSSKNFPNTVKDVVLDKDQYEAITKGLAFHDEDLVNFLKSDEGQKQIIEALGILQGRTDFKGQSQLKNRVVGEDPMLDPLGNFYHYLVFRFFLIDSTPRLHNFLIVQLRPQSLYFHFLRIIQILQILLLENCRLLKRVQLPHLY